MLLKKIFKPKWQNNNPDIRLEAVAQMQWQSGEEREILSAIIGGDSDSRVVDAAIQKVDKFRDLLELSKKHPQQRLLNARLVDWVKTSLTDNGSFQNLDLSADPAFVLDIATELRNSGLLGDFLDKLTRTAPQLLTELVKSHSNSQIRQAAADRITSPEEMAELANLMKNKDKRTYQTLKSKLNERKLEQQAKEQKRQELLDLCASLENHAETEAIKYYAEKLEALRKRLSTLDLSSEPEIHTRIETAISKCDDREKALREQQQEEQRLTELNEQQTEERANTLVELENAVTRLQQAALESDSELSALDGLLTTQENRWLEATRHQAVGKAEQKRYQQLMGEVRHYYSACRRLSAAKETLEQDLDAASSALKNNQEIDKRTHQRLRNTLNGIEWPEGYHLHSLLKRGAEVVGEIQTIQTQHIEDISKLKKKVEGRLALLSQQVDAGEVKQAQKTIREVFRELSHLPNKVTQGLNSRLRLEQNRLDELKDWQGFATRPKQEDLCQRMEYLASQHLEPRIKAQKIKDLQNQWRALGGSTDQLLWTRFKEAADLAFAPCREFFNEEDKLKAANLQKREAICVQLSEFLEQIDWDDPDWKALDKINRKAREEWRLYYPVDHKQGKPVQNQFNTLLATIDEHLGKEKELGYQQKKAIIAKAEELAVQEDVRAAASEIKKLQKQWESINLTDHKKDRALWSEFRKACDAIFNKLTAQRKEREEAHTHAVNRAEELIEAVTKLQENADESAEAALASLTDAFQNLEGLGDAQRSLQNKFNQASKQVKSKVSVQRQQTYADYFKSLVTEVFNIAELDPWLASESAKAFKEKHLAALSASSLSPDSAEDLLLHLEILAEVPSPEAYKERRMALQVERLTAGLQGAHPDERSLQEKFETQLLALLAALASAERAAEIKSRLIRVIDGLIEKVEITTH